MTVESGTEELRVKEFLEKYQKLCSEYGLVVLGFPSWKDTNHGTYELEIVHRVVKAGK